MKEDVLEQIVDDYLQLNVYFTIHNVRFKPSPDRPDYLANDDRVPSDFDVVGINPRLVGPNPVWVVLCKSWQSGFGADLTLRQLRGRLRSPSVQHGGIFEDSGFRSGPSTRFRRYDRSGPSGTWSKWRHRRCSWKRDDRRVKGRSVALPSLARLRRLRSQSQRTVRCRQERHMHRTPWRTPKYG